MGQVSCPKASVVVRRYGCFDHHPSESGGDLELLSNYQERQGGDGPEGDGGKAFYVPWDRRLSPKNFGHCPIR